MIFVTLSYFALALTIVFALAAMILKIGQMLGDCPQTGAAARAAAVTITTGFVAIGIGMVLLIFTAIMLMDGDALLSFLTALGLAAMALGLGFTHAVSTLRAVVSRTQPSQDATAPAAQ